MAKTETITIRVEPEEKELITRKASEEKLSIGDYLVRQAGLTEKGEKEVYVRCFLLSNGDVVPVRKGLTQEILNSEYVMKHKVKEPKVEQVA